MRWNVMFSLETQELNHVGDAGQQSRINRPNGWQSRRCLHGIIMWKRWYRGLKRIAFVFCWLDAIYHFNHSPKNISEAFDKHCLSFHRLSQISLSILMFASATFLLSSLILFLHCVVLFFAESMILSFLICLTLATNPSLKIYS